MAFSSSTGFETFSASAALGGGAGKHAHFYVRAPSVEMRDAMLKQKCRVVFSPDGQMVTVSIPALAGASGTNKLVGDIHQLARKNDRMVLDEDGTRMFKLSSSDSFIRLRSEGSAPPPIPTIVTGQMADGITPPSRSAIKCVADQDTVVDPALVTQVEDTLNMIKKQKTAIEKYALFAVPQSTSLDNLHILPGVRPGGFPIQSLPPSSVSAASTPLVPSSSNSPSLLQRETAAATLDETISTSVAMEVVPAFVKVVSAIPAVAVATAVVAAQPFITQPTESQVALEQITAVEDTVMSHVVDPHAEQRSALLGKLESLNGSLHNLKAAPALNALLKRKKDQAIALKNAEIAAVRAELNALPLVSQR